MIDVPEMHTFPLLAFSETISREKVAPKLQERQENFATLHGRAAFPVRFLAPSG